MHRFTTSLLSIGFAFGNLRAAEPADTNYDESKVPDYTLPSLLPEGMKKGKAREFWEKERRAEVLALLEENVYGKTPDDMVNIEAKVLEDSARAFGGTARRRQIALTLSPEKHPGRKLTIELLIYSPILEEGKAPAFIGLNFSGNHTVHPDPDIRIIHKQKPRGAHSGRWQVEMLLERGYGVVTTFCGGIDPDNYRHDFSDGPHPLFYEEGQTKPADGEWGTIGAWAWGLSQIRKWLEDDEFIDADQMAVIGHSRLGKTALWAGAQDTGFAMVVSNNSGCGGAALYRRCYGERIHHMLKPVGYWFCKNHARFAHKESEMPVDQHMLMAAVAPRALYVASATEDRWADPKGEFLAAKAASPIFELYGLIGLPAEEMPKPDAPVAGRIGYHLRTGKHDVTAYDWEQYLKMGDEVLKRPKAKRGG